MRTNRKAGRRFVVKRAYANKVRPAAFELPSLFLRIIQQRVGGNDAFSGEFGCLHPWFSNDDAAELHRAAALPVRRSSAEC